MVRYPKKGFTPPEKDPKSKKKPSPESIIGQASEKKGNDEPAVVKSEQSSRGNKRLNKISQEAKERIFSLNKEIREKEAVLAKKEAYMQDLRRERMAMEEELAEIKQQKEALHAEFENLKEKLANIGNKVPIDSVINTDVFENKVKELDSKVEKLESSLEAKDEAIMNEVVVVDEPTVEELKATATTPDSSRDEGKIFSRIPQGLLKRWKVVVAVLVIAGIVFVVFPKKPRNYEVVLEISLDGGDIAEQAKLLTGTQMISKAVAKVENLSTSDKNYHATLQALTQKYHPLISAIPSSERGMIRLSVQSENPDKAAQIARFLVESATGEIGDLGILELQIASLTKTINEIKPRLSQTLTQENVQGLTAEEVEIVNKLVGTKRADLDRKAQTLKDRVNKLQALLLIENAEKLKSSIRENVQNQKTLERYEKNLTELQLQKLIYEIDESANEKKLNAVEEDISIVKNGIVETVKGGASEFVDMNREAKFSLIIREIFLTSEAEVYEIILTSRYADKAVLSKDQTTHDEDAERLRVAEEKLERLEKRKAELEGTELKMGQVAAMKREELSGTPIKKESKPKPKKAEADAPAPEVAKPAHVNPQRYKKSYDVVDRIKSFQKYTFLFFVFSMVLLLLQKKGIIKLPALNKK